MKEERWVEEETKKKRNGGKGKWKGREIKKEKQEKTGMKTIEGKGEKQKGEKGKKRRKKKEMKEWKKRKRK